MIVYDDVVNYFGDRLVQKFNTFVDGIQYRVTLGWERSEDRMEPKISFNYDYEADDFIREMKEMGANEIMFGEPVVIGNKT